MESASALFWVLCALGALGLLFKKYSKAGRLKALKSAFIGSLTEELDRSYFGELYDFFYTVTQGALAGLFVALIVASPAYLRYENINFYLAGLTLLAVFYSRMLFEFFLTFYNYFKSRG